MRRVLFLICLLSSVYVSSYPMALRDRSDYDEMEDRSISHDLVKLEIMNDGVMIYFMMPLKNVFIQIVDDDGMLVHEGAILLSTSQCYYIPMQDIQPKPYLIRVEGDNIHEEFSLLF